MRSSRATHNQIAVSAGLRETAINVEQSLDTALLVGLSDVINLEPRRENNAGELTGREEPDTIYDLGATSKAAFTFEKAQPQHFAFLLAYGLGQASSAAAGAGYEHTLIPIAGDLDGARSNPGFTAAQRYGDTVLKRRFASLFVDSLTSTFARDKWCQIKAELKGSGKFTDNVIEETISAAANATSLTLAANGVQGTDAAGRLDNVQRIRAELTAGVWTEVAFSAVSSASPAVITITAPGAVATAVNYKVLYVPVESGWMTFPSRVNETPLRVSQMTLSLGGAWNGAAFQGGRTLGAEIRTVEWTYKNNLEVEYVIGAAGAFAGRAFRTARTQTIKLDREFRDAIVQRYMGSGEHFGLYIKAEGDVYDAPHAYQVELIFPKLGVLTSPLSVDGKRLAEAGDLQILEHPDYGSVIAKVKNLVSGYAA